MSVENAWKNFIASGSPLEYIEYSRLKLQEVKDADNNQGVNYKGDGCKG